MTSALLVVAFIFAAGIIVGAYALLAPRVPVPVPAVPEQPPAPEPWTASTDWTTEAGAEFAGMPESARCDLIFAVSDLHDERSQRLLEHALDDPSDAVALAAAHALASRGSADTVQAYAQQHPGERAQRILDTLLLLG
jgi:hypothetical protein